MKRRYLLIAVFVLISVHVSAQSQGQVGALAYLNELRSQAGMQPFVNNPHLQSSAQGHADYLVLNRGWGHSQSPGKRGYTGAVPMNRMLQAGYNNRHGSENVSTHRGKVTPKKSIDGLMSAIYHRFAFLSFDHDQVGIGHAAENNFHSFVYNMGNSRKEQLCGAAAQQITPGQYLYKICKQEKRQLRKQDYDTAVNSVRAKNAEYVVWPYDQASQVSPGFYEESPDPLPNIDVSGYPVSVQFNPGKFDGSIPRVSRFELFRLPDRKKTELAAYFNKNSDINRKFSDFEHAIFPLHRLEWNTQYLAELDYVDKQGLKQQVKWTFRTTDFQLPRYELHGGESITTDGEPFVVYMSPQSSRDAEAAYTLRYQGFSAVNVSIYDPHTLIIHTQGGTGEAIFDFHGRTFRVTR